MTGAAVNRKAQRAHTLRRAARCWRLYAMLLLPVAALIIFQYVPMYGILMAFENYKFKKGVFGSDWVGLKYFIQFFQAPSLLKMFINTITLSLYSFFAGFPFPILLALMLNEVKGAPFKKTVQTITYLPYFLSTVIVVGMIYQLFSWSGLINTVLMNLGLERTDYLLQPGMFKHLYVWSGIWQGTGYSSILYIAALAGVDPELYEAALIDGANRRQKMWHIDLPTIVPIVTIQLIMSVGGLISVGYEKVYLLQNTANIGVSEVISTYQYKTGLEQAQYSYSTAVGLLNSAVALLLTCIANFISRRVSETSLW